MSASISIREYIRWIPEEATEPTTTLVLTSPGKRFVDVRVLKPADDSAHLDSKVGGKPAFATPYPPRFTRYLHFEGDIQHLERLEWAFAGTSSSELRNDADGRQIVHSSWKHWVSSRTRVADGVVDEGDMFPQPDGRTLETGEMVNPATGELTKYEESWIDVEPTTTGTEDEGRLVCVVLILQDDANEARGMVVRVGQYCQGFMRVGDALSMERWAWDAEGGWRRLVHMGDLWLPCGVVTDGKRLELGGQVKYGEYEWKIVEMVES
jgi:hypothetical protein